MGNATYSCPMRSPPKMQGPAVEFCFQLSTIECSSLVVPGTLPLELHLSGTWTSFRRLRQPVLFGRRRLIRKILNSMTGSVHFNFNSRVQPRGESPNGIRSGQDFRSEAEDLPDSMCGVAPRLVGKGLLSNRLVLGVQMSLLEQ